MEITITQLFGSLYIFSQNKFEDFKKYIADNLANRFIQHSNSSTGTPILLVKKRDATLRLCIDYRGLNLIINKNCYSLLLISEPLDQVMKEIIFTKLNI